MIIRFDNTFVILLRTKNPRNNEGYNIDNTSEIYNTEAKKSHNEHTTILYK